MEAYIIIYCVFNSLYIIFAVYRDLLLLENSDRNFEISKLNNKIAEKQYDLFLRGNR